MQQNFTAEEVMALNRKDRRRLAKINGIKKIPGSNIPFVKQETKDKKGVLTV